MKTKDVKNKETEKAEKKKRLPRLKLLDAIEQIVELSAGSQLSDEFFKKAKRYIDFVSRKLDINAIQAVLFSIFVDMSDDNNIVVKQIANHLGCRTVKVLRYLNDIDMLEIRRMIRCCRENRNKMYRVPAGVIECLQANLPIVPPDLSGLSCEELFAVLADYFEQRDNNEMTFDLLAAEIKSLFEDNQQLNFVKKMQGFKLDDFDEMLLIYFCHLFVENRDDMIGAHDFCDLFDNKMLFNHEKSSLESGNNVLIYNNIVEYSNNDGLADRSSYKLSDWAKEELLSELNLNIKPTPNKGLLHYENIEKKELFYNDREAVQIAQLTKLLEVERFKEVTGKLQEKGMRKGFNCLFYGAPGTGKTETALQLAKATGRNIMQVNFAQLKSMWVGESEKNMKSLFDRYRKYVKESDNAPILLFNEADAIFGIRREGAESAVDKMENSIQNIILEEMEKLEGILIATTNLSINLDKAFDRRFLYKIKFERPCLSAKVSIWQTMLPELDNKVTAQLAKEYDFTGGQIENIARKQTIDRIISGKEVELETLKRECDDETMERKESRKRIGF